MVLHDYSPVALDLVFHIMVYNHVQDLSSIFQMLFGGSNKVTILVSPYFEVWTPQESLVRSLGSPWRGPRGSLGVPGGVPGGTRDAGASLGASWNGPGEALGCFWRYEGHSREINMLLSHWFQCAF